MPEVEGAGSQPDGAAREVFDRLLDDIAGEGRQGSEPAAAARPDTADASGKEVARRLAQGRAAVCAGLLAERCGRRDADAATLPPPAGAADFAPDDGPAESGPGAAETSDLADMADLAEIAAGAAPEGMPATSLHAGAEAALLLVGGGLAPPPGAPLPDETAPADPAEAAEAAPEGDMVEGPEPDEPLMPLRATVVTRETHFAPVGSDTGAFAAALAAPEPGAAPPPRLPAEGVPGRPLDLHAVRRRIDAAATQRALDGLPALSGAAGPAAAVLPPLAAQPRSFVVDLAAATPAAQLGEAIARSGAAVPAPEAGAAAGPVRILEIQLHPVELGMVTVRLRSGRDGLEVRVRAARPETARLLESDRAGLLAQLCGEGFGAVDLVIAGAGPAATLTGHDAVAPRGRRVEAAPAWDLDAAGLAAAAEEGKDDHATHDRRRSRF